MKVLIDIGSMNGGEINWGVEHDYEVHAFEPNPHLSDRLLFDFADAKNVTLNYAAAWNEDGRGPLYLMYNPEPGEDGVSMIREKSNVGENTIEVKTINTGRYLKDLNKDIDILKINAEGAEYIILESILNEFDPKRIKHWLVEDHSNYITDEAWEAKREEVLKRLEALGIKIEDYTFIESLIKAHE